MDLIQSILLGIIQGVFEWLPISSQGQIAAISMQIFNLSPEKALYYSIFLHLGTLLSAIVYFRNDIKRIVQEKDQELRNFILLAFLATPITAIPTYLFLKQITASPFILTILIGLMLLITGYIQKEYKNKKTTLNTKNSLILGLAQGLSIIPGISRSGITTATLLSRGFKIEESFRISFLLGIPTILAAEIVIGGIEGFIFDFYSIISLLIAFITGYITIDILLKLAKKIKFKIFCYALGIIYIGLSFI